MAQDMMRAVAAVTGNADATQVNPDFPGWWQGFLPPGNLP
jgi:homoserine acetyltransferase